jgi:hypothetical protein
VHNLALSKKITSITIIGSILIIFGYSEAYGQTTMASTAAGNGANGGGNTITRSDIIDCLINPCTNPDFQLPSNTSIIAMAIVNLTLTDIQDYREVLKSEISHHINDTIDNLATGLIYYSHTCAPPPYHNELPNFYLKGQLWKDKSIYRSNPTRSIFSFLHNPHSLIPSSKNCSQLTSPPWSETGAVRFINKS